MPTFFKGRKRELVNDDLYRVLPDHKSSTLGTWLTEAWQRQLDGQQRTGREPSLLRALLNVFGWRIVLLGMVLFSIELFIRYVMMLRSCESCVRNDPYVLIVIVQTCFYLYVHYLQICVQTVVPDRVNDRRMQQPLYVGMLLLRMSEMPDLRNVS